MTRQPHLSPHDVYYNRDRSSIYPHVREGENVVLDLGCGAGTVGRRLMELKRAKTVIGAEMFAPAAEKAATVYEKVYQGDIEAMALDYHEHFDYVICADVLEHLKRPQDVVAKIHRWLKLDGKLICSLPNVRYWQVLKDLLFRGDWEYQDSGIMDETHLRFFTRKSCMKMLQSAGFKIECCKLLIYGRKKKLAHLLSAGLCDEFLATQVLTVCGKSQPK